MPVNPSSVAVASASPPRLLDQVRARIRFKHCSIRTEQAYVDWVKRFVRHFCKRPPREMGSEEVRGFLSHPAVAGRAGVKFEVQRREAGHDEEGAGSFVAR